MAVIRTHRRPTIVVLTLALLGLRVLELHAGLAPPWHDLAQIALVIGMGGVLFAWFHIEGQAAKPARKLQLIPIQPWTHSMRSWSVRIDSGYRGRAQGAGEHTMRTGLHPNWVLQSALIALMIGLFLEQVALAVHDR